MNRNLIICIAFLMMAQVTHAMKEERAKKIKLGIYTMSLLGHIALTFIDNGAPCNKAFIYEYKHKKLVDKGSFEASTEDEKWKIYDEVLKKNYVFITEGDTGGPFLILGIKDRNKVRALLVKSLKKKLPFPVH